MGYRSFAEATFDDAIDSTIYTAEALRAYPAPEVQALAKGLDKLLAQEPDLRGAIRLASRAVIRANALVRTADGISDDHIAEFGRDVVSAVRQDRTAPLYVAIFQDSTPTDLIALSLAPEVGEIDRIVGVLEDTSTPAALRKQWVPTLEEDSARGHAALGARTKSEEALAKANGAARRWVELADRARRSIDGALTTYAAEHDLARDFNDRFFPGTPARRTKKVTKTGTPSPAEPPPT